MTLVHETMVVLVGVMQTDASWSMYVHLVSDAGVNPVI